MEQEYLVFKIIHFISWINAILITLHFLTGNSVHPTDINIKFESNDGRKVDDESHVANGGKWCYSMLCMVAVRHNVENVTICNVNSASVWVYEVWNT